MFMQNVGLNIHNKLAKMRYNNMPFWPLVTPHRTNRRPVENSIQKFANLYKNSDRLMEAI